MINNSSNHSCMKAGRLYALVSSEDKNSEAKIRNDFPKLSDIGIVYYDSLALWKDCEPGIISGKLVFHISNRVGDIKLYEPFLLMEKIEGSNVYHIMQTTDDKVLLGYMRFYFGVNNGGVYSSQLIGDITPE